jgi:hypothetical protein
VPAHGSTRTDHYRARCTLRFRHVSRECAGQRRTCRCLPQPGVTRLLTSLVVLRPEHENRFSPRVPSVRFRPWAPDLRSHGSPGPTSSGPTLQAANWSLNRVYPVSFLGTFCRDFYTLAAVKTGRRIRESGESCLIGNPRGSGGCGPRVPGRVGAGQLGCRPHIRPRACETVNGFSAQRELNFGLA